MNKSLLWRGALIVAALALAAYSGYPPSKKINLGLDLRGGMHLVLQVQTLDAVKAEAEKDIERLRQEAKDKGLPELTVEQTDATHFVVSGPTPEQDTTIGGIAKDFLTGWDWRREGDHLRFAMGQATENEIRRLAVQQALQTIRNRIDAFGVSEPQIQESGNERIVVQLPGVDDPERVRRLLKSTAFLEFRLVAYPPNGGADTKAEILSHYDNQLPDDLEILPGDVRDRQGRVVGQKFYALEKRRVITGRDLKTARPGLGGQFNQPVVNFSLTATGAQQFGKATAENVGRDLAIILDGKVQSAPRINSRITDSGIIEGQFSQQEVEDLSTVLRSGALPAGIVTLAEVTVGPLLGQDSIDQGIRAGLLGSALVVFLMLVMYKRSGVNAVTALALNIVLIFGCLAYFGATLTLPGIAGIVLTVGMAVDANVLVFERIKEELRAGRTVKSSIEAGFAKALSSIVDGNLTTLIAALFLFQFGTGPIRGFAVTLSIGLLASMFTAVFVSRWIFDFFLSRRNRVEKLSI